MNPALSDVLINPVLSSAKDKSLSKKKERALKYADLAIQGTNNSSIASKRSVESIYLPKLRKSTEMSFKEYFKYFVPKSVNRSPCINRGYWLRLHAIRSRIDSIAESTNQKIMVLNLGCGFDPLPFQYLDNENPERPTYSERMTFIDIDYTDVLANKLQIIRSTEDLTNILGIENEKSSGRTDTFLSEHYIAMPCDLNDAATFKNVTTNAILADLRDSSIIKIIIAEVSLAYMKSELADEIISICSSFPNSHFIMLEQLLPEGPNEPFGKQMLKHFKKNDSPLQSVETYPTIASQEMRFQKLGFTNVNAGDISQLWGTVDLSMRKQVEAVQPFDELEEFNLFCHHYLLSHATNNDKFEFSPKYKFVGPTAINITDYEVIKNIEFTSLEYDLKRNFGSSIKHDEGNIMYTGGCNPNRISDTLKIDTQKNTFIQLQNHSVLPPARACHTFTRLGDGETAMVIGGRNAPHRAVNDCWFYNLNTNEWQKGPELPEPRFRHSCVATDKNTLLVCGGKTDGQAFLLYDNISETFKPCPVDHPSLKIPLISAAVAFDEKNNRGIIMGGYNSETGMISDSLFVFTYCKGEIEILKQITDPLLKRYGSKAVFIQDSEILVVGGTSSDRLFDSRTSVIIVNIDSAEIKLIEIPESIWASDQSLLLVGHEVQRTSSNEVIVLAGGATCYGFGAVTNASFKLAI
ncbi:hypothetical protein KAFR_0I02910 [Kazachstania africana CBS 2517]|uniref:tRNA wybutosine-synthesizing protein 4 n=1 Tax=Kazachstania africana (strain ATCC 22294 / BCRC 22015 / CBS 2517 / CECT 1963 / NBRC 1671 / NRRL Y-8276) TaxID=1071382 RepID=H2B0C0_KAZAF|nr:hypothetical protein KAFR_0I02910 [Kazachstania africana CBS 2517]CCF60070.1 hypothetical protein KAFR_0I02910 [Kazachstania africana CBS 2517]